MGKVCKICGDLTMWFIWATTRDFNLENMMKTNKNMNSYERKSVESRDYVVCRYCVNKYGLLDK